MANTTRPASRQAECLALGGEGGELIAFNRRPTSARETKTFQLLETDTDVNRHSLKDTFFGDAKPHPETLSKLQTYAATLAGLDPNCFKIRRLFEIRHWKGPYDQLLSHHVAAVDQIPDNALLDDNVLLMTAYYILLAYMHLHPSAPPGNSRKRRHVEEHNNRRDRFWMVYAVVRRRLENSAERVDEEEGYSWPELFPSSADTARATKYLPWRKALYGKVVTNGISIAQRTDLVSQAKANHYQRWLCLFSAVQADPEIAAKTKDDTMVVGAFFVSAHMPDHLDDGFVYDFVQALQRQHRPKSLHKLAELLFGEDSPLYCDDYEELATLRARFGDLLRRVLAALPADAATLPTDR